jgi:4-amino-4-deoxy-L-arabinose transferase-like glycosyltransferase
MRFFFPNIQPDRGLPPSRGRARLRPELIWIGLMALTFALLFQGNRGLWGPDEGRFSNVALQMLDSGDWLTPHRHPEHVEISKLPITYWAVASSVSIFGKTEWALRLPSALAFVGTVLLTYLLSRRLLTRRPWLPAVLYLTNMVPFFAANLLTADSLMCFFQTLSVYAYVLMWQSESPHIARRFRCLMWAGLALAFLTKGIPALLPLFALLVYRRVSGLRFPVSIIGYDGPLLFLLLTLPWFLFLAWTNDVPLALLWGSYTKLTPEINSGSWLTALRVYAPVLFSFLLPWGLIASLLALTQYRAGVAAYLQRLKWERFRQIHQESVFLLSWILIPLLVLLLFRAKLWLYALPILVPVSIALGRALQQVKLKTWMALLLAVWLLLLLGVKGYAPKYNQNRDARELASALQVALKHANVAPESDIYFFDQQPVYGLKFYLNRNLKRISTKPDMEATDDLALAHIPATAAVQAVWLVESARLPEFTNILQASGSRVTEIAQTQEYRVLRVDN